MVIRVNSFLIIFISSWLLLACKSSKVNNNLIDSIEFGSGGGVSGRYQSYRVDMKKKLVLKTDGPILKTLSKKEFNDLMKTIEAANVSDIDFNHPYNMTYFITFSGNVNNRIVWGDPASPAPQKVKELYATLSELVK